MALDCNEIIADRLWVGSCLRPEDVPDLKHLDITTVISLQNEADMAEQGLAAPKLAKAFGNARIAYRRVAIRDFDKDDLRRNLPLCVKEIETALQPRAARVYLHCTAGMNRAPTAAAAYLIHALGMAVQEAYEFVLSRRYCRPYLDLLKEYAKALRGEQAEE